MLGPHEHIPKSKPCTSELVAKLVETVKEEGWKQWPGVVAVPRVPAAREAKASVQVCRDTLHNRAGEGNSKNLYKNQLFRNNPSSQKRQGDGKGTPEKLTAKHSKSKQKNNKTVAHFKGYCVHCFLYDKTCNACNAYTGHKRAPDALELGVTGDC